jgi:hypothetical protein
MRFLMDSITSKAYWQYVLFSRAGAESILAIFGASWLIVETLDFFQVYTRDKYAPYAYILFLLASIVLAIVFRRPTKSILVSFPQNDFSVEVRIKDLFEVAGAIMISTNTDFEADVAGGKIAPESLQGQFTARYFTGNQKALLEQIREALKGVDGSAPYPMGTTIPITTHGKTFYFTAMAELNEQGNASTSPENVCLALEGLWKHVREAGELQELVVPVVGTGRGRLKLSRKKMISLIAESFVDASKRNKFADQLVVVIRPEDASKFKVNLYDVKDNLEQTLHS